MTDPISDDASSRELIPQDCRALYESLIEEGARPITIDAINADPVAQTLLSRGLVQIAPGAQRPKLAPVEPTAALTRVLVRWLDLATQLRHDIDEACRQTVALHYRALQQRAARNLACEVIIEKSHVTALHASLMYAAERRLYTWVTGPYGEPLQTEAPSPGGSTMGFPTYLAPDLELLRRGGHANALYDLASLAIRPTDVERSRAQGECIRTRGGKLPMKMLIVDDHTVLVALGPYGHPALLIRSRPLVALFLRLFNLVWDDSTPWAPDGEQAPEPASESRERVLELMVAGLKDEAIARQCGVSVKTVRRQIATLMRELGARNRFAAGVAAVRRGWVKPAA